MGFDKGILGCFEIYR